MGAFRELDLDGKAARLNEAGGRLTYRFRARDVHLVMGPADPGGPVRFRVQIDETRREPRAGSTSVIAAGDSLGSAPLPTRPPARSGRRAHLRDHVPRARSRSVCVHLRLDTTREPCHGFTSGKGDLHDDDQRATFRDQDSHVAPDRRPDRAAHRDWRAHRRRWLYVFVFLAVAMNVGGYWFSDRLALQFSRAKRVEQGTRPNLEAMVEDLARRAELPVPRLYTIPSEQPKAFARAAILSTRRSRSPRACFSSCRPTRSTASWPTSSLTSRTATSWSPRSPRW